MKKLSSREKFGLAVQHIRAKKRISQESLADLAGIERSHMGKIERAEISVTIDTAAKIAAALVVPLSKIFREAEKIE